MDKRKIIIVTGTGGILGTGHIQRMLNLAVNLNRTESFTASIFLTQNEFPIDRKFAGMITDSIPSDAELIIRDMRDSTIEEMKSLKEKGPVLAIDDSGTGREYADFSLNLLPLPSEEIHNIKPDKSIFLYGYNFAEGISSLIERNFLKRDIDAAVYAGYNPSQELLSSIRKSIPQQYNSVLLAGGKALNFTGNILQMDTSYAEIISRSKIVITHFGLTMYEADACGCRIAALNPTAYHSSLTDLVLNDFNVIYSSEYADFVPEALKKAIESELADNSEKDFSPADIVSKISICTENFIKYITKICQETGVHS